MISQRWNRHGELRNTPSHITRNYWFRHNNRQINSVYVIILSKPNIDSSALHTWTYSSKHTPWQPAACSFDQCIIWRYVAPASQPVSPLSDRLPSIPDHVIMTWTPGQTPEEPQSWIRAWAVPISCPSQQCIPAPASPLQWRQSLPRTHCHGCRRATPLRTTMLVPNAQVRRPPPLPQMMAETAWSNLCSVFSLFFLYSLISSSLCF